MSKWALTRQTLVSNATINREISFARSAINRVASDFKIVLNNPFSHVKYFENDTIPNYLTKVEYQLLLQSALHYENYDLITQNQIISAQTKPQTINPILP